MIKKSPKYIENIPTEHFAKEILDMLDLGRKPIASSFSWVFFTSKIQKVAKDKCSHCAMALDYSS